MLWVAKNAWSTVRDYWYVRLKNYCLACFPVHSGKSVNSARQFIQGNVRGIKSKNHKQHIFNSIREKKTHTTDFLIEINAFSNSVIGW